MPIITQPIASITIDTSAAGSTYGTGLYGTATYVGATRAKWAKMLPLETEGRTLQVTLQYTGKADFVLYNYSIGVVPEPAPRGF